MPPLTMSTSSVSAKMVLSLRLLRQSFPEYISQLIHKGSISPNNLRTLPKDGCHAGVLTPRGDPAPAVVDVDPDEGDHGHEGQGHAADVTQAVAGAQYHPGED